MEDDLKKMEDDLKKRKEDNIKTNIKIEKDLKK
jgi:hypothetical protein